MNLTLQESEGVALDLIVVGTKDGPHDGRGRRERGHEELLEALDLAHQEIRKLARRRRSGGAAGKPKWLDGAHDEFEFATASVWARHWRTACGMRQRVEELAEQLARR